ncbi:hypothetical protein M3Y97_00842800 [Aphelenchoides bicaudatus]|nr:hypothetical protein M3Y97_00842800 [Aphelenchoides bicaudatus]
MEEQETEKQKNWSCPLCTYKNIAAQLKCNLCGTSRFSNQEDAETDAVKAQVELMSNRWSCSFCTFENLKSMNKCAKCETTKADNNASVRPVQQQPSKSATRSESPKVESSCSQTSQIIPKTTDVLPFRDETDLIATSSAYKWKCLRCTYLNFAASTNCTMCRAPSHLANKSGQRIQKEFYKPIAAPLQTLQDNRLFMVVGTLSRYLNFFTGQNDHEALFFRAVGSIISKHPNAIDAVVNYLISNGNVERALNHIEAMIVYDYSGNIPVACGDTLAVLARRCGLVEIQRLLERVSLPDDNLPCAAAAPNSDLYNRIHHIFHFCRAPYKLPFRAYNFNIFKLPFPKNDLATHLLNEVLQSKFDSTMKHSLIRYVQVATSAGQDVRYSTVLGCPSTLVIRNRGGSSSLFDAILMSMFGVCDRTRCLQDQLYEHLNSHSDWYKPAFMRQYRMAAAQLGINLTSFDLEDLWLACVSGTNKQSNPPEPIHIFALAQMISRPIVVLPFSTPVELSKRPRNLMSLANSRSHSYHFLEGFYLPYFTKNELFTRSPICLLHNNGQFYNWLTNTNEEFAENTQNFIIVNYPRNQLTQMFRFLDDSDEKLLRPFLNFIQLTPNSVAIHHTNQEDCIPEVSSYYFDYLNAAERALKMNQNMRIPDVMRQMLADVPNNPNIIKLFSPRAKRMLSRRPLDYENYGDENAGFADETATKMPKVNELKK